MNHAHILPVLLLGGLPLASAQVDAQDAPPVQLLPQEIEYDDLRQVTPAREALRALDLLRGVPETNGTPEGGLAGAPRPGAATPIAKPRTDAGSASGARYSVEALLTVPLYDETSDVDALWARVRGMKASFAADGMTAYPAFGRAAAESWSAHFQLGSVMLGGESLGFEASASVSRDGDAITLDHGSVREVYHASLEGIEQTFVFDALPGGGELLLTIDVDSNLSAVEDAKALHFVHESLGGLSYGGAFVVDAAGRRQAIERDWLGDSLALRVPADFLATATFPVTIDPPVTGFTSTAGVPDDSDVDVCFAGGPGLYWAVFEDYVAGTQSDAYAVSFNTAGTVVDFISIDLSASDWMTPKIAYHVGSDRCLVVASVIDPGGSGSVTGQFIDCATGTVTGSSFQISTVGALKVHPDVGGNNWDSTVNSHFLVAWSTIWTPGAWHQVEYRAVNWDGAPVTAVTQVTPVGEVHNEPSLSASHGDGDLLGDWWTLVWTADSDNNGFGEIMARRVVWSGNAAAGTGNFVVAAGANCAHPRVTSRFNRNLQHISDRPSVVVYERDFPSASGTPATQGSIYARVITDGIAEVESPVSWQLEDFDLELDQREPDIACDGNCFYLIYSEVFYGNPAGGDFDMYMLSGCITDRLDGAEIALAERHQNLAFSTTPERNGAVATEWDGSSNSISDDGMAIWEDQNVTNGGTLEGSTLEIPTLNQSLSRAVGRQFCDNNPNSGGGQGGRQASWSWLLGDQSVGSTHFYQATDLPTNTFGYAVIGTAFANINNPAGSLGRVCVPGGGRYVNQIASSGATGMLTTTIDPMNVPTPTGFISMQVGETWGFQYWHRDVAPGGMPSSNFSTACQMQFTN
ncbi:hypothetical protein Poly30_48910 [Planctomycetes bacterium Poly30]|uniref:Uncharacterized protein n=1 Tax=Saltatorellus ferox TaxID=2528018 RepID=A0A518EZ20_9BACT|nr:hypothetical protein Poly30_48910 [Planctomycetes bacterium Poly30]